MSIEACHLGNVIDGLKLNAFAAIFTVLSGNNILYMFFLFARMRVLLAIESVPFLLSSLFSVRVRTMVSLCLNLLFLTGTIETLQINTVFTLAALGS